MGWLQYDDGYSKLPGAYESGLPGGGHCFCGMCSLSDGATQIIFSLSGQQLKEKRDQALDLIEPAGMEVEDDTEQMDKMSVYYEQYQKTGYQNERSHIPLINPVF